MSLAGVLTIVEALRNRSGVGGLVSLLGGILFGYPLVVLGLSGAIGLLTRRLLLGLLIGVAICTAPLMFFV